MEAQARADARCAAVADRSERKNPSSKVTSVASGREKKDSPTSRVLARARARAAGAPSDSKVRRVREVTPSSAARAAFVRPRSSLASVIRAGLSIGVSAFTESSCLADVEGDVLDRSLEGQSLIGVRLGRDDDPLLPVRDETVVGHIRVGQFG